MKMYLLIQGKAILENPDFKISTAALAEVK
jgi:hypothetical protein